MSARIFITELHFPDGEMIPIPEGGVTVIVGPNNSGKSFALNNIASHIRGHHAEHVEPGPVISRVEISGQADSNDDVIELIENLGWPPVKMRGEREVSYGGNEMGEGGQTESQIKTAWAHRNWQSLQRFFLNHEETQNRLGLIHSAPMIDPLKNSPGTPIQLVAQNPDKLDQLSRLTREAFNESVCVNAFAPSYELRLGAVVPRLVRNQIPREVHEEYDSKPLVHLQGDGLRSFIGLLLQTVIRCAPITLIDEPEAFLHPPQARRLGRVLVEETPKESQLIIATHSLDVLQGILEATSRPIMIIRLDRSTSGLFERAVLPPAEIQEIWRNPLLKYSNLLDGLFHNGVVLTEGDADCRFYTASLDACKQPNGGRDLLFTHLNGKGRLYKGLQELRMLSVSVAAIADLDILNDQGVLSRTIDAAGGDWSNFEKDFHSLQESVGRMKPQAPTLSAIAEEVERIAASCPKGKILTNMEIRRLKGLLKGKSGWNLIKTEGLDAVDESGRVAGARIIDRLEDLGIFVVPCGELESWIPLNVSKQQWLTKVFEEDLHLAPSTMLEQFLRKVEDYFR